MAKTVVGSFEQIVKEAVETEFELRRLQEPRHRKLTAAAFVKQALSYSGSTAEKVEKLRRAIEANPAGFPQTLRFLRRATQAVRTSTMTSPPAAASHPYFSTFGRDDAQAELATVASHVLEAFVIAVQDAAQLDPSAFGDATDLAVYQKTFQGLQLRRQQLFQRIGTEFMVGDLAFERYDAPPT